MTELTDLLQNLAAELGTTVEYLWGVLIVQAKVSAITNIGFVVFTIIFTLILYRVHLYFSKVKVWGDDTKYTKSGYSHYEGIILVPMGLMVFLNFVLLITSISLIPDIVTTLVNPEYWALEQVLKLI